MANYGATKFRSGLMSGDDKAKLDELNLSLTSEASLAQIAGLEPTLDLQFNDPSIVSQGITFARNSVGSYYGYDGIMRYAAANEARIDYNPATEELKGLLIEEARTNLLNQTEQFSDSSWIKTFTNIALNAEIAPDGSLTASKLIETTSNNVHVAAKSASTATKNVVNTFSVFAKAGERSKFSLVINAYSGNGVRAVFDLSKEIVISTLNGGSGSGATASIQPVGNGWYKCVLTGIPSSTATTGVDVNIELCDDSGNFAAYTGDGKSGIYIWSAQLEPGSFPTSYIPSAQTFNGRSLFTNIAYANKSYAPTEVGISLSSITMKSDGTKMYLSSTASDAVYQYSLSTAWDVSTATYDSKSFTETGPGNPYGFRFNNDGTKAFRVYDNDASSVVREYTLSTAYDISTMTYASVSYSLAAGLTEPRGLEFSADGLFMYVTDNATDKIYSYTLGSAWSLSSVTASGELSVAGQDGFVLGITFDSTGKTMIICGNNNDRIFVYTLGTAWDITTAKYVNDFSVGTQDPTPFDIYLRPDNSNIYIAGGSNDDVFQYDCTLASNVSSYYDSTGTLVKSTDFALARNTYNPSPDKLHLAPKLLLEPQATNICQQSESFATTPWLKGAGVTITSNTITAPDGAVTADTIAKDTTQYQTVHFDYSASIGDIRTFSVFVKAGTATKTALGMTGDTTAPSGTWEAVVSFDLATKAITVDTNNGLLGYGIQELTNGWYRIYVSTKLTMSSAPRNFVYIGARTSTTAENLYLWGAQLETGYAPTSYIPTTTASVTRSADFYTSASVTRQADNASMTGSNFTSWYRFDEGTVYCESDKITNTNYATRFAIYDTTVADTTSQAIRSLGWNDGSDRPISVAVGGVSQAFPVVSGAYTSMTKYAIGVKVNDFAYARGDGQIGTDSSGILPSTVNRLQIGATSASTAFALNGHIKRLTFWPMRLSNDVLQKLTSKETSFETPLATKYRAGLMNTRDKALVDSMNTGVSFDSVGKATFTNDVVVSGELVTSKSQLTVAAGVVTANKSYHTIAGENGVADDLVTINGGVDGMRLLIRAVSDTVTITVKHNTGNIFLNGTDFVMDNQYDMLELMYDSALAKWIEIARANNGA